MVVLTEDKIKKEALTLFIEKGYAGTSLADIGNEVGIKKQSIYTHFKSKDDLFLQVMYGVLNEEIIGLHEFFQENYDVPLFNQMYEYILRLRERFLHEKGNIRFLLRVMFVPPTHLQSEVIKKVSAYHNELEKQISRVFKDHESVLKVDPNQASIAYLNIIDGLLVELVYVSAESFDQRLEASWEIYQTGVKKEA